MAIAGSFHLVILPMKIMPMVLAESVIGSFTSGRLYVTAIGPAAIGRFQASLPPQRFLAASVCTTPSDASLLSAESEPAQSTWPAMKLATPSPEPVGL